MLRSLFAFTIVLLALGSSLAFAPLPNSVAPTQSSTAVYFSNFFGGNKTNDKKGKGKKEAVKEEKKKKPMVMMFGKPQYDWVKGREVRPGENKRRQNWLYKAGERNNQKK